MITRTNCKTNRTMIRALVTLYCTHYTNIYISITKKVRAKLPKITIVRILSKRENYETFLVFYSDVFYVHASLFSFQARNEFQPYTDYSILTKLHFFTTTFQNQIIGE